MLKILIRIKSFILINIFMMGQLMAMTQTREIDQYEQAVLAGGCFWGVEKLFSELNGVKNVVNGYTGGNLDNPTYKDIVKGTTGHAEAVEITYDPKIVSYEPVE